MKTFLSIFFAFVISSMLLSGQNYEPNYPHIGKGNVEIFFTVVIGSMKELPNAERLVAKAAEKGFQADIQTFRKNQTLFNRVCVGKTKSRTEANSILKKVKSKLRISNAWILEFPVVTPLTADEIKQKKIEEIENEKSELLDLNKQLEERKKHEQDVLKKLKEEEQKRLEALKQADEEQLNELRKAIQEKLELEKQKIIQDSIKQIEIEKKYISSAHSKD